MSVARTAHLGPLKEYDLPVNKAALVVGGGVAGMTCALSLADQGFEVHLVEKDENLGGMARRMSRTLEGLDVKALLDDLIRRVYRHPLVHVSHSAKISDVSGYVGNFVTTLESEGQVKVINHGAAVLATGADEYRPTEHLFGQDERVCTQLELEEMINHGDPRVANAKSVAMIQCVGCRNEERNYCARVCCSQAIKNALALKKADPEANVYVLFRDMRTYGYREDWYRQAADEGVIFVRYEQDAKPEVEPGTSDEGAPVLKISVPDPVLRKRLELDADLLVLSVAAVPSAGSAEAARLFKVTTNPDGFLQEAHVKLRPVDFAADGVFLCGAAHYPKHLTEAIGQALGAAGRAVTLLSRDTVRASGSVAEVVEDECVSCGACISVCTYGAISFADTHRGRKALVNPVLCKGDGLCNTVCPVAAIRLKHYTDEELICQIDAAAQRAGG